MKFREAKVEDISQIQIVRNTVKENTLSNPNLVTDEDCKSFITNKGKGWVCEIDKEIVGFSIVDLLENNIWALFVHPNFENKGIGKQLQQLMLDWYFQQTNTTIWLGTAPNTRAEKFYQLQGWTKIGTHGKGETKFEMSFGTWQSINQ